MKLQEKYKTLFQNYGITIALREAHFMAQIDHESGLKPISESLFYKTIERARKTFKTPFENKSDEFVSRYLKNSEKMANYVYANRMGNGNEASGEGWKYRGRGFIQITGKENYHRLSNDTDIDFLHNPDLLLEEANAMISALWFWKIKGLNKFADADDILTITKRINGGTNGLAHRKELLEKYKQ